MWAGRIHPIWIKISPFFDIFFNKLEIFIPPIELKRAFFFTPS